MAIKCGHCQKYHESVFLVKECSEGRRVPIAEETRYRPAASDREVTEGMWYWGERILKVQKAVHASGHLYTKELKQNGTDGDWFFEMLRGGMKSLRTEPDARKMTLDEAAEFGKLYGICCSCGRTLTNELSIELGIGPICREKF